MTTSHSPSARRALRFVLRAVARLLCAALALALLAAAGVAVRVLASLPRLSGTLKDVEGISDEVLVVRDAHGVPHIFGKGESDVYFGLGFVHAQDRFFQMDLTRRRVEGRLSELLGRAFLARDVEAREHGLNQVARAHALGYPPAVRAAVEAYTAGVNAALARGFPAPEYTLLVATPERWCVEDTAAVMLALVDDLVTGYEQEVGGRELARYLSPAQLAEFLGAYPSWAPRSIELDQRRDGAATTDGKGTFDDRIHPGSNAWVLGGTRTTSGKPLLASDPHLALSLPAPFYLARLASARGTLVGATLPGAPFVVIGHNGRLAWAHTSNEVDAEDVSPAPALDSNGVVRRRETIGVSAGPFRRSEEPLVVHTLDGRPILRDPHFGVGRNLVLRSAALDSDNGIALALYGMQWATSVEEFFAASSPWTAPFTTALVASVSGDIGLLSTGRLPLRDEAGKWVGAIPRSMAPLVVNPRSGLLVSANNLTPPASYGFPMPGYYDPYRIARIVEALNGGASRDLAGAEALQRDVVSVFARRMLSAVRGKTAPRTDEGRAALARLERWDGAMALDRPEPLLFAAWMRELSRLVYADELDEDTFQAHSGPRHEFLDAVLTGELAHWCDVQGTRTVETCDVIAGAALDRALARLGRELSVPPEQARWGAVHQATFQHPLVAALPELGRHATLRVAAGGDGATVDAGAYSNGSGFAKLSGAALRVVFDLSDLDRSRFQLAPGQSGNLFSDHCRDLVDSWTRGRGFEIRTDWNGESPPEGARVLRLEPRES